VLDPATWRLRVGGVVGTPAELDLAALRAMPARTVRVTLECAGNGRARLHPRPVSQPWLVEAVGTAEWTGVPLRDVLAIAGVGRAAVEVVFTGADHGIERGVEQDYQRSLSIGDALGVDVLARPGTATRTRLVRPGPGGRGGGHGRRRPDLGRGHAGTRYRAPLGVAVSLG
jgi:DMSO/TMAO reductase YedYZ molybdopterin-dependent catalytic subunit